MQTDYLFNGIKGYSQFRRFSYLFTIKTKGATNRYKILKFLDKYGLSATMDAFEASKRTLYRWKATLKRDKNEINSLKSTKPIHKRESKTPKAIIEEIGRLRKEYPNIGKVKLHILLKKWRIDSNLTLPSKSTIGRIISKDKDKMRMFPYRINSKSAVKPKIREFKNRKPKGLKTKPLHMWAVDTIERVFLGIRRYIMTMIDPNSRIAFAVAIPTKNTQYTSRVLATLIDGLLYDSNQSNANQFAIPSDNGTEFKKEFDTLLQEKRLTRYFTYPRSPKMNAHNERFNRTLQEQFVDYNDDLLFTDIDLFNEKMADWLILYNTKIPNHSLFMKSPVQYLLETNPECQMLWSNTEYIQMYFLSYTRFIT